MPPIFDVGISSSSNKSKTEHKVHANSAVGTENRVRDAKDDVHFGRKCWYSIWRVRRMEQAPVVFARGLGHMVCILRGNTINTIWIRHTQHKPAHAYIYKLNSHDMFAVCQCEERILNFILGDYFLCFPINKHWWIKHDRKVLAIIICSVGLIDDWMLCWDFEIERSDK